MQRASTINGPDDYLDLEPERSEPHRGSQRGGRSSNEKEKRFDSVASESYLELVNEFSSPCRPTDKPGLDSAPSDSYLDLVNDCSSPGTQTEKARNHSSVYYDDTLQKQSFSNGKAMSNNNKNSVYYDDTFQKEQLPMGKALNHSSVYYDDTLGPRKQHENIELNSTAPLKRSNTDRTNLESPNKGCGGDSSDPNGTLSSKRRLPSLPPQDQSSWCDGQTTEREKLNNGDSVKVYKEPIRRESLMRALGGTGEKSSGLRRGQKAIVGLIIGVIITAIYIGVSYIIAKAVMAEFCRGDNSQAGASNAQGTTVLYGEIELTKFNETLTKTFISNFTNGVKKVFNGTILSLFLKSTDVLSLDPSPNADRIVCRFFLNFALDSDATGGIETFARFTFEERFIKYSPDDATLLCVVVTTTKDLTTYVCDNIRNGTVT